VAHIHAHVLERSEREHEVLAEPAPIGKQRMRAGLDEEGFVGIALGQSGSVLAPLRARSAQAGPVFAAGVGHVQQHRTVARHCGDDGQFRRREMTQAEYVQRLRG
jgi:hypothetical protein